jgi:hypothetical protein
MNDRPVRRIIIETYNVIRNDWNKEVCFELQTEQQMVRDIITVFVGLGTENERKLIENEKYRELLAELNSKTQFKHQEYTVTLGEKNE